MRHRVTFIHSLTPEEQVVETLDEKHVTLSEGFNVAREDRYTFTAPDYKNVRALRVHINKGYEASTESLPFSYSYQIGLHFYVRPVAITSLEEREEFYTNSARLISDYFGVKPESQTWIPSLGTLYVHVQEPLNMSFTTVNEELSELKDDWTCLDYHTSDNTASLKLFYPEARERTVNVTNCTDFTEVGIFSVDQQSARDDLVLSGARVVFNDAPDVDLVQKTLFHVKPRHRMTEEMSIEYQKNGLHPVLSFGEAPQHPVDEDIKGCILYSYFTLGKSIFLDPYQIPLGFNVLANYGTKDLELPEYAVKQWGNEILVEHNNTGAFPFDLTLHTRYQLPSESSHKSVLLEKPVVFYACEGQVDSYLLNNSPFDNKKSPGCSFEKFFTDDTIFYHVLQRGAFTVDIPSPSQDFKIVNITTFTALLLGVSIIIYKLFGRNLKVPKDKKEL